MAMFVFNYWLREFLLSAFANRFELRCEPKQLILLYYKICPTLARDGHVAKYTTSYMPLANTGCPRKFLPSLYGCCGEAVDSSISVFTQLHR